MPNKPSTSPYAIICKTHGQIFIDIEEYARQMMKPDSRWQCPICKDVAEFDDINFDLHFNEYDFNDNTDDDIAF